MARPQRYEPEHTFIAIERRHPKPAVRLGMFGRRGVEVANASFLLTSAAMYSALSFVSLYVQDSLDCAHALP